MAGQAQPVNGVASLQPTLGIFQQVDLPFYLKGLSNWGTLRIIWTPTGSACLQDHSPRAVRRRRSREGAGVELTRVRRRCKAKLQGLDLPVPFDIHAFCRALEVQRGRQIWLCPVDTRTGPCGLWVATTKADYLFYEQATTRLHQDHIRLHELGHLVFNHHSGEILDEELAGVLGLDVELIRRMLARTTYSTDEEQEAEVFATLVLERAVRDPLPSRRPPDPEIAEVVDRLQATLEGAHSI